MTVHARRPDPARLVLGVLLARPERLAEVRDLISEHDFYSEEHRRIWRAILAISDESEAVDFAEDGSRKSWFMRVAWHLSHAAPGREFFDDARTIATLLDPAELADAGMLPLDSSRVTEFAEELRAVRRRLLRVVRTENA